jgi:hypothetical protein
VALAHPTYGYRRVHRELTSSGITIGLHTIRRFLRVDGLTLAPEFRQQLLQRVEPQHGHDGVVG